MVDFYMVINVIWKYIVSIYVDMVDKYSLVLRVMSPKGPHRVISSNHIGEGD